MRCFFISSRRRHTRYIGDWSSDVCSSDLDGAVTLGEPLLVAAEDHGQMSERGRLDTERAVEEDLLGCVRQVVVPADDVRRSEERRVGKECRSRRAQTRTERECCRWVWIRS